MSEIKVLTTPFSIIQNPKELLYHGIFDRLLNSSKKLRKIKKNLLDYIDYKLNISVPLPSYKDAFDGFEINMFYHGLFSSKGKLNFKKIELLKEKYPNIYSCHGNYEEPIGSYKEHKLNLANELDKEKINLLISNVDCANILMQDNGNDFKPIIFHAGFGKRKVGLDNVVKNISLVLEHIEKENYKIDVLLENLPKDNENYLTTNSEDLLYVRNKLGSNKDIFNFGFCFDFGHANSAGLIEEESNSNFKRQHELIDELGNSIKYAHLNYNEAHKIEKFQIYEYKRISDLDWHAPFPLNEEKETKEISEILTKLKSRTSISKNGLILLEVFPKYYFPGSKYMKIETFSHGYEDKEILFRNVYFIRNIFK